MVLAVCSNCDAGITRCPSCDPPVMLPVHKVDQTTFGVGVGNCWTACIATITGIPLETIPNFCALYGEGEWYLKCLAWLRPHGFALYDTTVKGLDFEKIADAFMPDIPWIATGPTARGNHCCVYIGSKLWHDPNPCRDGLLEVEAATFFLKTQYR